MENKLLRNSVSFLVVIAMVISLFALPLLFTADKTYAESNKSVDVKQTLSNEIKAPLVAADPAFNANAASNKHVFTAVLKPNKWNPIYADGHRYSRIVSIYQTYLMDPTKYVQGEEFFAPVSINVKGKQLDRTFSFYLNSTSLTYKRHGVELYSSNAGKYTITTQFKKYYVEIQGVEPYQTAYFREADSKLYPKKDTFFVQTKVKLSYDKKKGKLTKKKRTQWKNPTKKYGKLPKPKAKKGYKFTGWYTKKSGGKKIKSSSKVPSNNNVTLYARYKKK